MTRLWLATGNAHKVEEVQEILGAGFEVEAQDTGVEETGTTFEANALLKAHALVARTGEPAATVSPFARNESFAVYGMPSSGPSVRPSARRASDAAASPRASGLRTTTALSAVAVPGASNASMRAK